MNLADGRIISAQESRAVLAELPRRIQSTLCKGRLSPDIVLQACDRLVNQLDENGYLAMMAELGIGEREGKSYLQQAKILFSRAYLQARLDAELGPHFAEVREFVPPFQQDTVRESLYPLGVLLHIAAGNADGLPAFSVLEGLLTGNINILKLPEVDGGISARLLLELINQEPLLAEYVYVFDYSSKEIDAIRRLTDLADGVVVWGGDAAIGALRGMVGPQTRLIEWGHKVSFAYVTKQGMTLPALTGLATGICESNQLLCSSCQGVYLDTDNMEDVFDFCQRFLPVLEQVSRRIPPHPGVGIRAQTSLQVYNAELEQSALASRMFKGERCSLLATQNPELEASILFRNCWVKPLAQQQMLPVLRHHKNHLHTAGLLCAAEEQQPLSQLLWKAGVVRVTSGAQMSAVYCGEAHDGEYPLQRYVKRVSFRVF